MSDMPSSPVTYCTVPYDFIIPPVIATSDVVKSKHEDDVLGEGNYGRVIRVECKTAQTNLSLVLKEVFETDDLALIVEEAKILLHLERTGYVPVCFGLVSDEGLLRSYGILQECVGGGLTLETYITSKSKHFEKKELLYIAKELATGLQAIHNMDVLLNDIKSDNILLDLEAIPLGLKYCDFGLASYQDGLVLQCSSNGPSSQYLAPEIRAGDVSSEKSDIYSLGYVFYDLINFGDLYVLSDIYNSCIAEHACDRIDSAQLTFGVDSLYTYCDSVNGQADCIRIGQGDHQAQFYAIKNDESDLSLSSSMSELSSSSNETWSPSKKRHCSLDPCRLDLEVNTLRRTVHCSDLTQGHKRKSPLVTEASISDNKMCAMPSSLCVESRAKKTSPPKKEHNTSTVTFWSAFKRFASKFDGVL